MMFRMDLTPRLVARASVPAADSDGGPMLLLWPHRRVVTVRADRALIAYDLDRLLSGDTAPAATFPAPWPRNASGVDAVSPDLDVAVFAGPHALQAVEPGGTVRWELRHACWTGSCKEMHEAYAEYAGDRDHRYPDGGSAWIGADTSICWAHVRGPLQSEDDDSPESWLVVDLATGKVRARVATETYAAGSHHIPHPDPATMGLSVGEGQDGSPMLWATWNGNDLTVTRLGDDRILVAAGPDDRTFLTVTHARRQELNFHHLPAGELTGTMFADQLTANPALRWDFDYGTVNADTLVASTSQHGHGETDIAHWLIDPRQLTARGPLRYPTQVRSDPQGLRDNTWLTTGPGRFDLTVWRLPT
jgi:hypothetical protein